MGYRLFHCKDGGSVVGVVGTKCDFVELQRVQLAEEREQMRAQAKAEAVASMNLQRENLVAFASAQLNTADSATQERAVALVREQAKQHSPEPEP